jgi:integrase
MARACKLAEIPRYHPHDHRDRRLTIWHHAGIPAREVAHRAGHARTSESLDTYTHVVPVAELADDRHRELIDEICCPGGVLGGVAPLRTRRKPGLLRDARLSRR